MIRPRLVSAALLVLALSACGILPDKETIAIYNPLPPALQADPTWPASRAHVVVMRPTGGTLIDSPRIVVRPTADEWQVYKGAVWSDPAPDLLQAAVLRTLEDSGKLAGVGRRGSGVAGDFDLLMDIRRFDADYAGGATPSAIVEVSAKLLSAKENLVRANRVFRADAAADGTDLPAVNRAFQTALGAITGDIAAWTLQETSRSDTRPEPR